jgi:4-hydroxybutyryl-CoA dehydratase/vinylacetyl-CoA-Delta-isomerase
MTAAADRDSLRRCSPRVFDEVELVEHLLERNVLAGPGRKIAKNRQPGRCCDTGCTPPSPTTMVEMPAPRARKETR